MSAERFRRSAGSAKEQREGDTSCERQSVRCISSSLQSLSATAPLQSCRKPRARKLAGSRFSTERTSTAGIRLVVQIGTSQTVPLSPTRWLTKKRPDIWSRRSRTKISSFSPIHAKRRRQQRHLFPVPRRQENHGSDLLRSQYF